MHYNIPQNYQLPHNQDHNNQTIIVQHRYTPFIYISFVVNIYYCSKL